MDRTTEKKKPTDASKQYSGLAINTLQFYNIEDFNASLKAKKLLCSNNLEKGLKVRKKDHALKHLYIQCNFDTFIDHLVLDMDKPDSIFLWETLGLPPPNIIVKNQMNGHSHYIYALKSPICKSNSANLKPLEFFAKIQQAITVKAGADLNYVGLITKNPNSKNWHTWVNPVSRAYSLEDLADWLVLPARITKKEAIGEGRNCYLFDTVRKFAYKEVIFYKENGARYDDFFNLILDKLDKLNIFPAAPPLGFNELKAIAKSISKWVWRNFTPEKAKAIFKAKQSARGKKGGKASGITRTTDKRNFINEYANK